MLPAKNETADKQQMLNSLSAEIRAVVADADARNTNEKLLVICTLLVDVVPYYDWVGFYLVARDPSKNELVLGPFAGEPPEHRRIPFGKGLCGQAAERKETVVSQDVTKEMNYLACSPHVKSEIVVPILKNGALVGVLDIDSHTEAPFTAEDRESLQTVCEIVSELF